MKKIYVMMTLFCVILTGCLNGLSKSTTTSEAKLPSVFPESEKTKTSTFAPTQDLMVTPSFTTTTTVTPQPTPLQAITERCLEVSDETFHSTSTQRGVLALISEVYQVKDSYLLDLQSGNKTSLPDKGLEYLSRGNVSADGNWFAYVASRDIYSDEQLLIIVNSHGVLEKSFDLRTIITPANYVALNGWLDNDHLILVWPGEDPQIETISPLPAFSPNYAITVILEPFTGEWVQYSSSYPDMFTLYPDFGKMWGIYNLSLSVYNSPLDRVLYLSYEGVMLWNITSKRSVKLLPDELHSSVNRPIWLPDGSSFIIDRDADIGRNIFQVTKDGKETQLTFFKGYKAGDFFDFSLSPDGRLIAFWLLTSESIDSPSKRFYDLHIMKIDTGETQNLCIHYYRKQELDPIWYPIWAPDNSSILIRTENEAEPEKSKTVIVDLINYRTYQIANDVIPLGWMK